MTHETTMTISTRFHNEEANGTHVIDLTPRETVYIITHVKNLNHLFSYLNSLNRWTNVPDDISKTPGLS